MTTPAEARELLKSVPLSNWQEVLRLTKIINDNDLARYKTAHAEQQKRIRELEIALEASNDMITELADAWMNHDGAKARARSNRALLARKEKK